MKVTFPDDFLFGTSTSAFQIETAGNHDWRGLVAKDGSCLEKTIDHELHRMEDAQIISSLGNAYRCSLDWSKLQHSPGQRFDSHQVDDYRNFLGNLRSNGLHIMLVLNHFTAPVWFSQNGGWANCDNIKHFVDYAKEMQKSFGDLVDSWNTFNEPNNLITLGYIAGQFPPFRKNIIAAIKSLNNVQDAHDQIYNSFKEENASTQIGVSLAIMRYHGLNLLGRLAAKGLSHLQFVTFPERFRNVDFVGLSYYGAIPLNPAPICEFRNPGMLDSMGKPHDDLWEYSPSGIGDAINIFWQRVGKPIIICENGSCTTDDSQRINSIKDHLYSIRMAMKDGADVKGYFHWSTFDNFETILGMRYKLGLVEIDPSTMKRTMKDSGRFYASIAREKGFEL